MMKKNKIILILMSIVVLVATAGIGAGFIRKSEKNKLISCEHIDSDIDMICDLCSEKLPFSNYVEYDEIESEQTSTNEKVQVTGVLIKNSQVEVAKLNKEDAVSLAQSYKKDILPEQVVDAFDIDVTNENLKYQPTAYGQKVKVKLSNLDMNLDIDDSKTYALMHIMNNENYEILPISKLTAEEIEFTTGSFSTYIIITVNTRKITFDGENYKVFYTNGEEIVGNTTVAQGTALNFNIAPNDDYEIISIESTLASGDSAITITENEKGKVCNILSVDKNITIFVETELVGNITTQLGENISVYATTQSELMERENGDVVIGAYRAGKTEYTTNLITKVIFTNKVPTNIADSWDVSSTSAPNTVTSYLVPSVKNNGIQYYAQYIVANTQIKLASGRLLFKNYTNVKEIEGIELLDTSNVTDMYGMFLYCNSLKKLNLGENFDTSNVTYMYLMFQECNSLTELNLGKNFNTSNVKSMHCMFATCSSLTELNLGEKFNTENVTDMSNMFYECSSLTELNLGDKFDTSNVTNMNWMFSHCTSLKNLNFGTNFDTSNVTTMNYMFSHCSSLETLVLPSGFDRLTGTSMFGNMSNLTRIISLRRAPSQSYIMEVSSDTGIENTNAIFYVAPQVAKAFYEITDLGPILGASRIKPILELVGSDSVSTVENATYIDQGVTIAGWTNEEASKYQNIGLTYIAKGLPVDTSTLGTKTITYNLQYTDSTNTTSTFDTLTRTVTVNVAPQLMGRDVVNGYVSYEYAIGAYRAGKTEYSPDLITKVVFTNTVPSNATVSWDASSTSAPGTVTSYLVPSTIIDGAQCYAQYFVATDTINARDTYILFKGYSNLTQIENIEYLTTNNATDMYGMFFDCKKLTTLDISKFDTSNVTNMNFMFYNCTSLKELNLGENFDTGNVTSMACMFYNCNSLKELNLGGKFDTSKVTSMVNMFANCNSLTKLNIGTNFDTSQVTNMSSMFYNCYLLKELNLGRKFDTSKVANMKSMFAKCNSLTKLNIGTQFDTNQVTDMSYMFYNCNSLTELNLGEKFDTSQVTSMVNMFANCNSLAKLNIGTNFDTSNVIDMSWMFGNCTSLTELNFGKNFVRSKVTTRMSYMFYNCNSLKELNLGINFDTSKVTTMDSMFYGCSSLTELNLGEKFDTSQVTVMSYMFYNCNSLKELNLGINFDTSKVTNMEAMFYRCTSLTKLNLGDKFDTSNVEQMYRMFSGCTSLETLVLPSSFDRLTGSYMFDNTPKLTRIISLRSVSSESDLMQIATNNGLSGQKAILYVPTASDEALYEANTTYISVLGAEKIKPFMSLVGNNPDTVNVGTEYVDPGATVFDWNNANATNYNDLGYILEVTGLPIDTSTLGDKTITYTLKYTNKTNITSIIDTLTRTVTVSVAPQLMARESYDYIDGKAVYYALGARRANEKDYTADRITKIIFTNTVPSNATVNWDASLSSAAGTVTSYLVPSVIKNSTQYYDQYIVAKSEIKVTSGKNLFCKYTKITEIKGMELIDTSNVANMNGMFNYCNSLTELNFGEKFDTSNVANMDSMFHYCNSLTELNFGEKFDTSNVTDMGGMFYCCSSLTKLNLGDKFDTSNVIYMYDMFGGCNFLTELNLGEKFDTSNVTDMCEMFEACESLTELNLGEKFDTSNVIDMSDMFYYCNSLVELNLGEKFDTSNVTDMEIMFGECYSLEQLNLGDKFDTSQVTNMYGMFCGCYSLEQLNLGENFDTRNVTDMEIMFCECYSLEQLNLGDKFDTSQVTDMSNMFGWCESLAELNLGEKFNTSNVTYMSGMFEECSSLIELNLGENFDTSNVTNMNDMFYYCNSLTELNLGDKFDTSQVTDMGYMFDYCTSLETLVLPSNFDRLTGTYMFGNMTKLTRIISLRSVSSESDLMQIATNNGLSGKKAILYVPTASDEALYEANSTYISVLGVEKIKPFMSLLGANPAKIGLDTEYVDAGATVFDWNSTNAANYNNLGYTVEVTGLPVDTSTLGTKTITYNLQYTDSANMTTRIDKLTRTVTVANIAPQLMARESYDYIDGEFVYYALGAKRANEKDYTADRITKIIFTNTVPSNTTAKWDVSAENATGTVTSYLVPSVVKDGTQYYDQYIVAKSEIKVTSGENLFNKYTKITEIKGMELLDTRDVTNMFKMFYDCDSLTNLNLGENFNTSNVTDMYGMFEECRSLTELNLGDNFDTSNVSDMYGMFGACKSLVELNLGDNFDTSNVIDMGYMFSDCWSLKELSLGKNFDTSNVVNMHAMFGGCSSLTELNLGEKFYTSNVEDMNYMFCSCYVLTQLNLGQNFDTSNVTGMDEMFSLCYSLTKLNLGEKFDTSNVTDMCEMFYCCESLTELNLGDNFDTSNVTDMYSMFNECYSLTELNLGEKFNTNNVADMSYMFADCTSLEIIQLGKDFAWLDKGQFEDCDSLKAIITERQITSPSDAIKLPENTGLKDLPNAILYVLDPVSETNYENAENYESELGADRIRPILELQGEEYVVMKPGEIYTESGATVAGLTVANSDIYTGLGYTLSSTSTVKENVSGRYEVVWTVYKPTGNALMSVKRDVYVRYIPTVPTITVTQGATQISSGNWANGNVVVTIGGSEYTEGAIEYIYSINGSEWTTGNTFNYEQETLSTIIRAKARGVADNEDISSEATFELKLDKTVPEIVTHERIRYDGVNEVISLVTYDGGISSGIEAYAISATNDISTATWQTRNELLIPENGTWYTWVRDNAGNVSEVYTLTTNEKITVEVTSDGKTEYYSDVYKAIETLNSKGVATATIKLLENNMISSDFENSVIKEIVIYADSDYTLDLNGKELVCNDGIVVRGKLTIANSAENMSYIKHEIGLTTTSTISVEGELIIDGNVRIESASNAGHAIEVLANGKAELRNGKVISNNSEATIHNVGTLTLGKEDNTVSLEVPYIEGANVVVDNDATLNIYDGKLVSTNKKITLDGKATTLQSGYHLVENETETIKEMYLETNDTWIEYWDISKTAGVDNVYAGIKIVEGDGITDNTRYKLVVGGTGKAKSFVLEYIDDKILTDIPWFDKYSETIVELDLEEGVTRYGDYTFYRLINVESLKLPDSLEAIGASAFAKMRALKGNVNIPKNVTTIANDNPFYDTMLTSFTVDAENTRFKVVNDTLYGGNKLIAYPTARTNATTTVIDGTVSIGVSAFAKNQYLKTVTLPDTLEIIDWGAFETTAIEEITIPASVNKIQGHAFIYCRSLKAVYLKSTELGESSSKSRFIDLARNSIIYTESKAVADLLTPDVEYTAERTKVYYPFEITTTLADAEIARGDTLHFEVEVIDGYIADDVVYQWYKDGVAIPGANSLSYTKTSFTNADEGVYKLVVRSAYQSNGTYYYTVESNKATISLGDFEAPEEVNSSVNYNEDGTATITVTGKDKETGVNEIIVNGNPIEIEKNTETGAATGKFDISKSGDYTVEVKDYEGNTTAITITAYEIHYKPNATTYTGKTNYQIKIKDTDIRIRANGFEKAGYNFTSWNTKEDNTGKTYKANDLYTGNEDMTLYATWNVLEYVVRFYNDNGINGEQLVSEATYPYGATITVPEEQYKIATEIEGDKYRIYYHKDNWTAVRTDANSKEKPVNITSKNKDTITMVDSNVNYYASYTYKDYSTKQSTLKVDGKTQITGNEVGIINNEGLVIIGENSTQTSTPTITGNTSIQNNNGIVMWYQANFIGPTQGLLLH